MTISDWLMIVVVLVAPLAAVHVQRILDWERDRRRRKSLVFQTLMATRATRLSPDHVQALNMIDIEFHGRSWLGSRRQSENDKDVIQRWREYLDSLDYGDPKNTDEWKVRMGRSDELFLNLLHTISQALGYDFDKVHLKKSIYVPVGHGQLESDQQVIRESLVKILSGDCPLPIETCIPDELAAMNKKLLQLMIGTLDGKQPLSVVCQKNHASEDTEKGT